MVLETELPSAPYMDGRPAHQPAIGVAVDSDSGIVTIEIGGTGSVTASIHTTYAGLEAAAEMFATAILKHAEVN